MSQPLWVWDRPVSRRGMWFRACSSTTTRKVCIPGSPEEAGGLCQGKERRALRTAALGKQRRGLGGRGLPVGELWGCGRGLGRGCRVPGLANRLTRAGSSSQGLRSIFGCSPLAPQARPPPTPCRMPPYRRERGPRSGPWVALVPARGCVEGSSGKLPPHAAPLPLPSLTRWVPPRGVLLSGCRFGDPCPRPPPSLGGAGPQHSKTTPHRARLPVASEQGACVCVHTCGRSG